MEHAQDSSLHFLDYWRVIRSRKEIVLSVLLLIVFAGVLITLTLPKIYEAQARISVRKDNLDIDVFERQMGTAYDPFFLRTQYEIIRSSPILQQVVRDLKLQEEWGRRFNEGGAPIPLNDAVALLGRSLGVEQYRDTNLIAIRFRSESPAEAARVANRLAEVYRDQRLILKRGEIERAVQALQNELLKQQELVNQAENELETLRRDLGVALIGRGMRVDTIRLQQLEADRINARVDMLVRKARLDALLNLSGEDLLYSAHYLINDPSLAAIRRQIIDTDVSLKLMLENLGENHPDVRQLRAGQAELRAKLAEALEGLKKGIHADYEVSKKKFDAIEEELERAKSLDIMASGERFLPFDKAERDVALQREILNALRARVTQKGIELEVPRTAVEIIEPAEEPRRPVSPKLMLNFMLSAFVGLIGGVGLAYFIEYLDTSVKTVDDVEKYLGLPVLGVIPQKVKPLVEEGPDSPNTEAYRVLRTNMLFKNKGLTGGAFAVVSGGVGEGKSTTLFNLAYTCAQLGDKVLIVDSDLRRPVQHTILGLSNRFGLTNLLMKDVPIEETIKPTSVPNLHFMPSGRIPRSALGILDTQRMRELVKNLKARYDYVFFDSPPIMGVSDAAILSSEVDGVLLVVQYRKYPRIISRRARQMIDSVGGNLLGVVLNNINIMRDDYYYYYHSYYSPYHQATEEKAKQDAEAIEAAKDRL